MSTYIYYIAVTKFDTTNLLDLNYEAVKSILTFSLSQKEISHAITSQTYKEVV